MDPSKRTQSHDNGSCKKDLFLFSARIYLKEQDAGLVLSLGLLELCVLRKQLHQLHLEFTNAWHMQ